MTDKVTPIRTYLIICGALLLLTLLTYSAAWINLGPLHTPVGLAIAAAKAALVILFFMHARYSTGTTRIVILAGLLWFGILMAGILDDFITRGWLGVAGK